MKIRALKALTIRDDSGELTSIAHGGIAEVSSDLGNSLITDGLAEAYTLISPTGSVSITANGTVDVTQYAQAAVNIADFKNLVDRSITTVTEDMLQGITTIGSGAFYYCTSLASVTIPNSVTNIESNAFNNCTSLTSITIPNSVTSIGDSAFYNCTSLASITIPNSVTSIGSSAFSNCTSLASITVEATNPPTLGIYVFSYAPNQVIYVPAESVDAYKSASGWSNYADKIQAIPEE